MVLIIDLFIWAYQNFRTPDYNSKKLIWESQQKDLSYLMFSFQINNGLKNSPSFAHLCVISHLFESVRYVFEMSDEEKLKFSGGKVLTNW